jgi:hypothetical protein
MPIRIYDLAKEVKRSNAEVVAMLEKEGFGTLSPSSNIDDVTAEKIRNNIKAALKAIKDAALAAAPTVPFNVTVQALGDQLGVGPAKILEVLVTFGITKASPTQRLSPDAATKIARKLGILIRALRSEEETVAEREAVAKAKAEKENPTPAPKPAAPKPAATRPNTPNRPMQPGQRSGDPADRLKDLPAPSVPFTVPTPHYNRNIPVVAVVGSKDDTAPKKAKDASNFVPLNLTMASLLLEITWSYCFVLYKS